jgi:NAD(P)-dependent dehydrogenase (short-subunit alcohol dehydrogenase family)
VFAGVRREKDAESLRAYELALLRPLLIDVTCANSIAQAAAELEPVSGPRGLFALVNNAGVASGGPQESIELDEWRRVMEVNVFGAVAMSRALLPQLRKAPGARIINVSSAYGVAGVPFIAPYCASKHALEAISCALRSELRPWGLHVSVIAPADVRTPIWDKAERDTAQVLARLSPRDRHYYEATLQTMAEHGIAAGRQGMHVDRVAAVIVRAVQARRPKPRYAVGWNSHLLGLARRFLPTSTMEWIIRRQAGL